jgi:hypothetical protein
VFDLNWCRTDFSQVALEGMPFHTTCLDIYMRQSRLRFGTVDVRGLMEWFIMDGDYNIVNKFPHHEDIRRCSDLWWLHLRGTEYLAANPVFVPRLAPILRSAIQTDAIFNVHSGAFSEEAATGPLTRSVSEIGFDILPDDLRLEILSYLGSKDIANLRLASGTFYQLPISIWRRLLRDEVPWLWEVWSDETPYYWTFINPVDLKAEAIAKDKFDVQTAAYRNVIEEEMPELLDDWKTAEEAVRVARPDPIVEAQTKGLESIVCSLPSERTNWYQLYTEITRNWKDLKGLHNRSLIWKDVEEIMNRIQKHREDGKISS